MNDFRIFDASALYVRGFVNEKASVVQQSSVTLNHTQINMLQVPNDVIKINYYEKICLSHQRIKDG